MNPSIFAKRRDLLVAAGALGVTALAPAALGQAPKWPSKRIRIVQGCPGEPRVPEHAHVDNHFTLRAPGHDVRTEAPHLKVGLSYLSKDGKIRDFIGTTGYADTAQPPARGVNQLVLPTGDDFAERCQAGDAGVARRCIGRYLREPST